MTVVRGYPGKPAEDWIAVFRSQTRTVSAAVLTVCVSLLVSWLAVIEPIGQEFMTVLRDNENTKVARLLSEREMLVFEIRHRIAVQDQQANTTTDASDPMKVAQPEERERYDKLTGKIEKAEKDHSQLKQSAVFEVFGGKFLIPKTLAVFCWSIILVGLLAYIVARRLSLASMLLKAKAAFEAELAAKSTEQPAESVTVEDIAGETPFWLAPVATLAGDKASCTGLFEALGWDRSRDRFIRLVSFCLIALFFVIQLRVAWIGYVMTDHYHPAIDAAGFPVWVHPRLLPLLSDVAIAAMLVASATLGLRWALLRPTQPYRADRRSVLAALAGGAAVAVATVSGQQLVVWYLKTYSSDRRRSVMLPEPMISAGALPTGFYRLSRSNRKRVYHVNALRRLWAPRFLAVGDLLPTQEADAGLLPAALTKRHRTASMELAALERLNDSRKAAIDLLWTMIRADFPPPEEDAPEATRRRPAPADAPQAASPPAEARIALSSDVLWPLRPILASLRSTRGIPLRLYDLQAILLLLETGDLTDFLKELQERQRPTLELIKRARKWGDPNSHWRKRIAEGKGDLIWKCPMPGVEPLVVRIKRA
ncbi:MAG: hypothetical protein HY834_11590 [Devosia nanyangense]|uniref:Uncharacterized protein n=1 Tax=Devosia nanyangense TaxID=1228055 RepID=A0A933NWY7_9HYPH|nr:hypothetical protein [Devosia nanyangense]